MNPTCYPDMFIARIGKRLVDQFENARAATTPGMVGDAMEQPVGNQLEKDNTVTLNPMYAPKEDITFEEILQRVCAGQ